MKRTDTNTIYQKKTEKEQDTARLKRQRVTAKLKLCHQQNHWKTQTQKWRVCGRLLSGCAHEVIPSTGYEPKNRVSCDRSRSHVRKYIWCIDDRKSHAWSKYSQARRQVVHTKSCKNQNTMKATKNKAIVNTVRTLKSKNQNDKWYRTINWRMSSTTFHSSAQTVII